MNGKKSKRLRQMAREQTPDGDRKLIVKVEAVKKNVAGKDVMCLKQYNDPASTRALNQRLKKARQQMITSGEMNTLLKKQPTQP